MWDSMNRNYNDIVQIGEGKVLKDKEFLNLYGFDNHWLIELVIFKEVNIIWITRQWPLKIVINVFDMGY
jgi:hypothetical protein